MLVKPITFTNFEGEEITKKYYFNLSKAELMEMEIYTGGLKGMLETMVEKQDGPGIFSFFKDLIIKAIGEKDSDGITFRKSKDISDRFIQSEAYSELLMELLSDADKATAFIQAIVPKEMAEQAQKPLPIK